MAEDANTVGILRLADSQDVSDPPDYGATAFTIFEQIPFRCDACGAWASVTVENTDHPHYQFHCRHCNTLFTWHQPPLTVYQSSAGSLYHSADTKHPTD